MQIPRPKCSGMQFIQTRCRQGIYLSIRRHGAQYGLSVPAQGPRRPPLSNLFSMSIIENSLDESLRIQQPSTPINQHQQRHRQLQQHQRRYPQQQQQQQHTILIAGNQHHRNSSMNKYSSSASSSSDDDSQRSSQLSTSDASDSEKKIIPECDPDYN